MVDDEGGVEVDPICGRLVVQGESEELEFERRRYFFCSGGCKARFQQRVERTHAAELARVGGLLSTLKAHWGLA